MFYDLFPLNQVRSGVSISGWRKKGPDQYRKTRPTLFQRRLDPMLSWWGECVEGSKPVLCELAQSLLRSTWKIYWRFREARRGFWTARLDGSR